MAAAFSGFIAGSIVGLQQVGFGLAAAIRIDVTLIRGLLVPSVMQLIGRWNWWLPERLARIVRVAPSPFPQPGARVGSPKQDVPTAPAAHGRRRRQRDNPRGATDE